MLDSELQVQIRKFILDFSNKKRSAINALALAALLKAYKTIK